MVDIKVQKKDLPFYRVFNDVEGQTEAYVGGGLSRDMVDLAGRMNPFKFRIDGQEFIIDRGDNITLPEGTVKHLVGDWDIVDDDKYVKEMQRVIDLHSFIPKLRLQKLLTPKETAEKDERLKNKMKYQRPKIEVMKAKHAPKAPIVEEEPEAAFTDEAIEEGEKKKGPGRPKKAD